jgi:hypothetical protein
MAAGCLGSDDSTRLVVVPRVFQLALVPGCNSRRRGMTDYTKRTEVMFQIVSICNGGHYRYCRTIPKHPRANAKGLYPLHRVLMENKLGRLLEPHEIVHHLDEDATNDDPNNLGLMTRSTHAAHHAESEHMAQIGRKGAFAAHAKVTHRGEVMKPPGSAAMGPEVGHLNMPHCDGTGAVPQGMEAQATQPSAAPAFALECNCAPFTCRPQNNIDRFCWRSGCPIFASDFPPSPTSREEQT